MSPKVVLITGALSIIGRAVARRFAMNGERVVVSDRDRIAGDELADALCATGAQAEFRSADFRSDAQVAALMRTTVERFGRIDIAINASPTDALCGALRDLDSADYATSVQGPALSAFLCMKHELNAIVPNERGSIVNVLPITPAAGACTTPLVPTAGYAVAGLTKSAALEVAASGIRVNAVAPRASDAPDEVARIVAFLASEQAAFITGSIFGAGAATVANGVSHER